MRWRVGIAHPSVCASYGHLLLTSLALCCSRMGDHEELRKAATLAPWERRKALMRVMRSSLDVETFVTEVKQVLGSLFFQPYRICSH